MTLELLSDASPASLAVRAYLATLGPFRERPLESLAPEETEGLWDSLPYKLRDKGLSIEEGSRPPIVWVWRDGLVVAVLYSFELIDHDTVKIEAAHALKAILAN